jgi:DNA-binding SARP family transcriptional activator
MITVQLLGGACLRAGELPLAGPPVQRHRIALLTLIVAAWPSPLSRDRAMALLWPERDLASARRLLNLAVHVLRATLGEGAIVSTGDGLVLGASRVSCDLHALGVAIAAGEHDRVARLYTGPLLDGFHLAGAREFTWWLEERRSEIGHAYVKALLAIAEQQRRSGDLFNRVATCRRLVAADPYSTQHALTLVQALSAVGDYVGARHFATEHAHRLRAELDVAVDPEIVRQLGDVMARQADLARRITVALEAGMPDPRVTAPA